MTELVEAEFPKTHVWERAETNTSAITKPSTNQSRIVDKFLKLDLQSKDFYESEHLIFWCLLE